MMSKLELANLNYRQNGYNTCVLASYAVACYPFTHVDVLDYMTGYCTHFGLDNTKPERSYDADFHHRYKTARINAYKLIEELHNVSQEECFLRARSSVSIEPIAKENVGYDTASVETRLKSNERNVLVAFVLRPILGGLMKFHSIMIGYDAGSFYLYDTALLGLTTEFIRELNDIAELGSGFYIVAK